MKTKKLIELLMNEDPSGEMECFIGNEDIYTVYSTPMYWDGCPHILIRDETLKNYNVIGSKIVSSGSKINIRTLSTSDALDNNPDLNIEFENEEIKEYTEKTINRLRKEAIDLKLEVIDICINENEDRVASLKHKNYSKWIQDKEELIKLKEGKYKYLWESEYKNENT